MFLMIINYRREYMNILSLVLSITAFVCAFVPIYGIAFTVVLSVIAVVLAYVKTNKNENKEGELIAVVISIFAIIVCVIVNAIYIPAHYNNKEQHVDVYADMAEYPVNNSDIYTTEFKINVENIIYDEDKTNVTIRLEAMKDDSWYSIYDFALYGGNADNYTTVEFKDPTVKVSQRLDAGENVTINLTFNRGLYEDNDNFLVFKNSENGVKIRL